MVGRTVLRQNTAMLVLVSKSLYLVLVFISRTVVLVVSYSVAVACRVAQWQTTDVKF